MTSDVMTAPQFQEELKRIARFEPVLGVEDPLRLAVALMGLERAGTRTRARWLDAAAVASAARRDDR